jgi:uncharacterized protein
VRIALAGGSGLIGMALTVALRERGDTVTALVRPTSAVDVTNSIRWDPSRSEIEENDIRRVGGVDAIVNLAGAGIGDKRWNDKRKDVILSSRVLATNLLAQSFESLCPNGGHFVNASAIGWYGDRGDVELDETAARGTGYLADVCETWENTAAPLKDKGATVSFLRTGIVLSARGGALKKQLPLFRVGLGGRFGSGDQWMSPVSLLDEVRAILWTLDTKLAGPINIVGPTPLRNGAFAKALGQQLHRPSMFAVPAKPLEVVLGPEMAKELLLASQRVLPLALLSSGFSFTHLDAHQSLQWALSDR